jgi:carbon storage regulator
MVVLRRRCYETIMVGDDVEITVIHIDGDGVRLGITAPPEVPVHRKEAQEAIRPEGLEAAWAGT